VGPDSRVENLDPLNDMDRRASIIASTIVLISDAAANSPETISSARRAKPPTFFPNMTPKVLPPCLRSPILLPEGW
jgi:hypothetical protein